MGKRRTLIGACHMHDGDRPVEGGYVVFDGELFYRIANYHRLAPFFISVVSDSDHWLFISSNGALTAGRRNPEHALFPYTTDDKIHDAAEHTGSRTIIRVEGEEGEFLWEPFSDRYRGVYETERFLYKNRPGNQLIFEEVNHDLNLSFRYAWLLSERFGFVRRSQVTNLGGDTVRLRILDGVQNLLPANVNRGMQTGFSTLVDAYKKSELLQECGIGIYSLSSIPVDRPEPSESLTANTVWSTGIDAACHLLSSRQLDAFRQGEELDQEESARGLRGAYFVQSKLELPSAGEARWFLVADVDKNHGDIAAMEELLASSSAGDLVAQLEADIRRGTERLFEIVEAADGSQCGQDMLQVGRHFSNTLCNVMRGGIFADGYLITSSDLRAFLSGANRHVADRHREFLEGLPEAFLFSDGLPMFRSRQDPDLERLYFEYLPLTFSRRHGDPSRPWNLFSIETRNPDGSRKLAYEGNWRDIFQNWEALGFSYPEFLEGMIFKFVNASTADGYNPYRITRDGIDWEVQDPDDPWSYIGYWGDHQIIYLLKLLEHSDAYHPGRLREFLDKSIFVFAHVPYRIQSYESLLDNPRDTIDFDGALHDELMERSSRIGSDGMLLHDSGSKLIRVNLTEKLLVPVLAKLANFIPEAGIWMNTQRPEWNDANNALVGNGVSMVTLCHLRRYLDFCTRLFSKVDQPDFDLSAEFVDQFREIHGVLRAHANRLQGAFDSLGRRELLDALGAAAGRYRETLYRDGLSGNTSGLPLVDLLAFLELARGCLDQSIAANRRNDGLYHSYNLMQVDSDGGVSVRHLAEMLEGQVAVLCSGLLDARACLELLQRLRDSSLYRQDQHSYLLYPDRELPSFMEKNTLPDEVVANSPFLRGMLQRGDGQIVVKDSAGRVHFNSAFHNASLLARALESMEDCSAAEHDSLLAAYESVFDHQSFTGRSGSFFKYEGLGCIYWHMVSKLLLAAQEVCLLARAQGEDAEVVNGLVDCYRDIQRGIGARKSVIEQGAFPTDPYSHTPSMMGAQQPGLTGQVKEDFIARMIEVGIRIEGGCLRFDPFLLPDTELDPEQGKSAPMGGRPGRLSFTFCGVPIVIEQGNSNAIRVVKRDGAVVPVEGLSLDGATSEEIFKRSGSVKKIEVSILS